MVYVVPNLHELRNITNITQFVGASDLVLHPDYIPTSFGDLDPDPGSEGARIFDAAIITLNITYQYSKESLYTDIR